MKILSSFILSMLLAVSAMAGMVKITLNGNKNFVVMIDGRTYTPSSVSSGKSEIVITDLANGQHEIEILRPNNRGVNREIYSSSFNLSSNESIHITVNANGRVRIEEMEDNLAYGDYGSGQTAMSDVQFRQLYQTVNSKSGQAAKLTAARELFNSTSYYFSTSQVRQTIQLINAEANRLALAKLAYDNVVDKENFSQVYSLLSRQVNRDELDRYVLSMGDNTTGYPTNPNTGRTAMSDASFTALYQDIRKKWLPFTKMSAAADAFNVSTNYFTTSQARQIIALVSSEANRLELAKLSFDNIVDPANFTQLYDLLSSQASRDELEAYVRAYRVP